MQIVGYLKTSVIEWPGKISSVFFTLGCNFRCPFCHNANLIEPENVKMLRLFSEKAIIKELKEGRKWIDAIVVSGGEPTLQADLENFLSKLKQMGFLTMIHTNGTRPQIINRLIDKKLIDYFCMDLKGNFEDYDKYVGIQKSKIKSQNLKSKIKKSVEEIITSGLEYEFRTTIVPGLHSRENLIKLAGEIKDIFEERKIKIENCSWFLQQFQPQNCYDSEYKKIKPYTKEQILEFQKELQKIIPNVMLRGI